MKITQKGDWEIDLGGIRNRELAELGELLHELGDKGRVAGVEFDLETLRAGFDASTPEVYLFDADGNTTREEEE